MHIFNRWTRHSEGSQERQQVEEAAGKRCHLQEHLTLITPVGILAQPFVFRCVLNITALRSEGKEKEVGNCTRKGSPCAVRTRNTGGGWGLLWFRPPIIHGYRERSQGHDYSLLPSVPSWSWAGQFRNEVFKVCIYSSKNETRSSVSEEIIYILHFGSSEHI